MKRGYIYLLFLIALTSCRHSYYVPQTQNVPLFKEKNEIRLSAYFGQSAEISTVDVQTAYSITNNFAVMANGMYGFGGNKSLGDYGQGYYLDGALGYYKPLRKDAVVEIFGGFGASNQNHKYGSYNSSFSWTGSPPSTWVEEGFADLSYTKVFIQPSIGYSFSAFDLALTTSFSNVNFNYINNQISPSSVEFSAVEQIAKNRNSFFFEPAITARAGWKYVKFQLQLGISENLSHSDLYFENAKLSGGLSFAFADRFRKKKKEPMTQ